MGKKSQKRRNSSDSNNKTDVNKAARHGGSPGAAVDVSDILNQTNSIIHGDTNYTAMDSATPSVFPQMIPTPVQTLQPVHDLQQQQAHEQQQTPISPVRAGAQPIPQQYAYNTPIVNPGASSIDIMSCLSKIESRLTQVDNKMKTLEKVEQKIDDFDRDLKKLWVFVKDNMAASNEKTSKLESQVENVELSVGFAHDKLLSLEKENKQLRDSVVDIQARSMRDNLVWGGIHDDRNETQQQTEDKIRGFMCEVLEMDKTRVDQIRFERVHRTGSISPTNPKRKIITKFSRFPEKEEVRKLKNRLDGTPFFIHEQFPPEIVAQRRKLMPRLKAAKSNGKSAWISYTTLYVDGKPVRDDT